MLQLISGPRSAVVALLIALLSIWIIGLLFDRIEERRDAKKRGKGVR